MPRPAQVLEEILEPMDELATEPTDEEVELGAAEEATDEVLPPE